MYTSLLLATTTALSLVSAQSTSSPDDLANSLGFDQPAARLPFPSIADLRTYSNSSGFATAKYIRPEWSLYDERIQWGTTDIQFVEDPAGDEDDDLVFKVDYPQGSYSHSTGGTQFYAQPLNKTDIPTAPSALLTYRLYVPADFDYVRGGKLPGLRGGERVHDCSGGDQADGKLCFSTRLMWREEGRGEIYAYIPITEALCATPGVICNSDYGTSFGRGSFTLQRGAWNDIALHVKLNDPVDRANGVIELYYNGVKAMGFDNIVLRTSTDINNVGGIYFSTFFGGDNPEMYATPVNQSLYWKDMQVFGSAQPATGEGEGYTLVNAAQGSMVGNAKLVASVLGGFVAMMLVI